MNLLIESKIIANVKNISKKYLAVAKQSGENFNIFKILNLTSNEVRTHSAFLAEILSKDGTHEMGNVFFVKFLETLKLDCLFNTKSYKVEIEKHIGFINDNYDEGGRIDIILTDDKNNSIMILKMYTVCL